MTTGGMIIFLSMIGIVKSDLFVIIAGYLLGVGPIFAGYTIKYRAALAKKGIEIGPNNKNDKIFYKVLLFSGWGFLFILTFIIYLYSFNRTILR